MEKYTLIISALLCSGFFFQATAQEFNITRRITCNNGTMYKDGQALSVNQAERMEDRVRERKIIAREDDRRRKFKKMKQRLQLIRLCLDNEEEGGGSGSGGSGGGNYTDALTLEENFTPPHNAFKIFSSRYRISLASQVVADVYFTSGVSQVKAFHAANVILQYLDNNEDGVPDNPLVAQTLSQNRASLIMSDNRNLENKFNPPDGFGVQPLYEDETIPNAAANGQFDFALEECLHLVFTSGYALAYPSIFGEIRGSYLAQLMEQAKVNGHYNPFANEPGMDYPSQVSEYQYWALTSMLGAQELPGRPAEISNEWTLYNRALVQAQDQPIFLLLTEAQYGWATRIPDGVYGD